MSTPNPIHEHNPIAGVLALAFAGFTAWYMTGGFWRALVTGYSPGKLGAIYPAGSYQYVVFLGSCLLGLFFAAITAYMGLKWIGLKVTKT